MLVAATSYTSHTHTSSFACGVSTGEGMGAQSCQHLLVQPEPGRKVTMSHDVVTTALGAALGLPIMSLARCTHGEQNQRLT